MTALLEHDVPGGAHWSLLLRAGRVLRLTALDDGAVCSTLLFAAGDPVDRLNVPDTLKAQMSARIRPPMVLMSDRGAALASVTGSSLDWHDCLTGHSLDGHVAEFGPTSYGTDRNDWRRSARSGLLSELRKHGRGPADLHACVNFFAKVAIGADGDLAHVPDHARAGDWVSLRAEQDLLVVLSTAPHPMSTAWAPGAVRAEVEAGAPYGPDDPSVTFRPESARALANAQAVLA
ncbi:urea amidolyase associated protein UAAP1 [Blastococcus sp. URHD0036]|uniref:urea amidolyase associated protein UAAP1 n=1 Tax=Blastococcus sp. URHD0036 TaxID=1380356 RepID=UPI000496881E|nr:urea amidolyase associated protein UAAP1 [Blastococcus sp. URHD0036]